MVRRTLEGSFEKRLYEKNRRCHDADVTFCDDPVDGTSRVVEGVKCHFLKPTGMAKFHIQVIQLPRTTWSGLAYSVFFWAEMSRRHCRNGPGLNCSRV
jgi:hypothetical protein